MRAGIPLLLALFLALAGCIDSTAVPLWDEDEVTFDQVRDEAEDAAKAWNADAQLVGAFAFESKASEMDLEAVFADDPDVGNGRAVAWAFAFVGGGRSYNVVVAANGSVVDHDEETGYEPDAKLGAVKVDSDDAMDAAREDDRFTRAVASVDAVSIAVGDNGTGPKWILFTYQPFVFAIVDATSGDLEMVREAGDWTGDWFGDWDWDEDADGAEGSSSSIHDEHDGDGSLSANDRTFEFEFDVDPGADTIEGTVTVSGTLMTDVVDVRLEGPDGEAASEGGISNGEFVIDVEDPMPGTWVLTLTLERTALAADYEYHLVVEG